MTTTATGDSPTRCVHRIEVHARDPGTDPVAAGLGEQARHACGPVQRIHTARIFLIEAALDNAQQQRIADELLADPIGQEASMGVRSMPEPGAVVEVHFQPGVMDPVAQSTQDAIVEMIEGLTAEQVEVRTGMRYDLIGADASPDAIRQFAESVLANTVIQDIHLEPFLPERFPQGTSYAFTQVTVPIHDLDETDLRDLSRTGHLFLSLEEMRAIQRYFQDAGREPTDVELETIAQTWSEHCVHKTLKSTIQYREIGDSGASGPGPATAAWGSRPGHELHDDGSLTIHNLLKTTIAAATRELKKDARIADFCVSVFEDNAGIVRFDDDDGVCIKVETHNHPSAIEPYGGAATGIGGCIRDVLGTGLAARPIANTDVFCVAPPEAMAAGAQTDGKLENDETTRPSSSRKPPIPRLPKSVIPPRRILSQVVAGVRDYGNRMGIPTVNGAVWFHDDYVANPLVYCGCVGLIPLNKCFGAATPGDRIIALGGRTGRDGIHGATFSSAELTDHHADEFSHAVQIGNAITQKKMMDVILQARDHEQGCLFHAITDCGAGGFSSAVGEMGQPLGARVTLETAPLKYKGLNYTEIWISEAQERMILAVPPLQIEYLRQLCDAEDVEMCDLGEYGASSPAGEPELVLSYHGNEVGRLSMSFLHNGIPTPTRQAVWSPSSQVEGTTQGSSQSLAGRLGGDDLTVVLHALLAHPNIASKHWIVRQYDHEVQGTSVVKPLTGPHQDGPSDAAVLRPKLNQQLGIALGCGLQPHLSEKSRGQLADDGDSYWATLAAIDEAVRNVVCVGADPSRIAILDNFCWPNCDDPRQLGSLVRSAEACYDGAMAYRTPFVSGKDSLSNQFTTDSGELITIPPTLLITALGIVPDVRRCRTMDAKQTGDVLLLSGPTTEALGGSHYVQVSGDRSGDLSIPRLDLELGPRTATCIADLIGEGHINATHDPSDGGLLVAAAEMAFAGRIGLDLVEPDHASSIGRSAFWFAETPGRYLLEIAPDREATVIRMLRDRSIPCTRIGTFAPHARLRLAGTNLDESLESLRRAWMTPLDW